MSEPGPDLFERVRAETNRRFQAESLAREAVARTVLATRVRDHIGRSLEGHRGVAPQGDVQAHVCQTAAAAAIDVFIDFLRNPPATVYCAHNTLIQIGDQEIGHCKQCDEIQIPLGGSGLPDPDAVNAYFGATDFCGTCCTRVPKVEVDQGLHKHPPVMD